MTVSTAAAGDARAPRPRIALQAPLLLGGLAFIGLYWEPFATLLRDWWHDPEAGHGLLLGPLSVWLMYRAGITPDRREQTVAGLLLLGAAVLLRLVSGLAAELFTMRFSLMLAGVGIVVYVWGFRQVLRWWLPIMLLVLSIPLPAMVLSTLALPLQLKASAIGATLLEWRDVPVRLSGNVIDLPGRSLFVTEACSGLRSLTALVSLGLLMGGVWLRHPALRVVLLAITVPVAVVVNGLRVFVTGFLVFFVSPDLGEGFMHLTEGWALFVVAFAILGAVSWALSLGEQWIRASRREASP